MNKITPRNVRFLQSLGYRVNNFFYNKNAGYFGRYKTSRRRRWCN